MGIDDLSSQDQQQAKLQPTATVARICLNPDEIYKSVAETGRSRCCTDELGLDQMLTEDFDSCFGNATCKGAFVCIRYTHSLS